MKPSMLICLLLFVPSLCLGTTDCKVVEYADHSEVICIGDEKIKSESNVPATSSRATIADYIAQNHVQVPSQTANPVPSAVAPQPVALPSAVSSQPASTSAAKPDSAAENLAKRRELATRNTRNLMNYSSGSATPGQ